MKSSIKLNQLVASLEAMEEQELNVNPEDSLHEMQEAQIALEGYQDLLVVHNRLTTSGVKLDESIVGNLLSLASPKINKDPLLSSYSEESVTDKAKDFGKWIVEKIQKLIAWLRERVGVLKDKFKNVFSKLTSKKDKVVEELKIASKEHNNKFKFSTPIVLDNETDKYSNVCDGDKLFTLEQLKNGIETLLVDLPEFLYKTVNIYNMAEKHDARAYIDGINKIANGNKKIRNDEGIELRNVPNTNFYMKCTEMDENGTFKFSRAWGALYIKDFAGEDAFPKSISVDSNYANQIDDFTNLFIEIHNNMINKYNDYIDDVNMYNDLYKEFSEKFKDETSETEREEELWKLRFSNHVISDNLKVINFAGDCAANMITALLNIAEEMLKATKTEGS